MSTFLIACALKGDHHVWVATEAPPESDAAEIGDGGLRERLRVDHARSAEVPHALFFADADRLRYSHATGEPVRACMVDDIAAT